MLYTKTIKQWIAFFVLVVFAFSITPQKNIHDFVAKHIDPTNCKVHINLPVEQVEHATVHCSYDQLVASAPFIEYAIAPKLILPTPVLVQNERKVIFHKGELISLFDPRGPPTI